MGHRWDMTARHLNEAGNISVHISRSWTEEDHYIFAMKPSAADGTGAEVITIMWE